MCVAIVPMRAFAVRSQRVPLPRYDAHIHRQADGILFRPPRACVERNRTIARFRNVQYAFFPQKRFLPITAMTATPKPISNGVDGSGAGLAEMLTSQPPLKNRD